MAGMFKDQRFMITPYPIVLVTEDNAQATSFQSYLAEQLDFARGAERLARARYQAGATGVQPWLDEQNRLWDAELALLGQQKEQLNTMARIYKALGGSDRS